MAVNEKSNVYFLIIFICFAFVLVTVDCNDTLNNEKVICDIVGTINKWKDDFDYSCCRPFVVASYAQSLDGKIAPFMDSKTGATTSNYPLSGKSSLLLTHAIRSKVDAVLVGGRTLSIDNPRLTNRLWGDKKSTHTQPKAVILDSSLCHIIKWKSFRRVKNPVVCCSWDAANSLTNSCSDTFILPCNTDKNKKLCVKDVLAMLYLSCGIRSLMVEGGAAVLTSFHEASSIDALCLTIAPTLLGTGIEPKFTPSTTKRSIDLKCFNPQFCNLDNDIIFLSRMQYYTALILTIP